MGVCSSKSNYQRANNENKVDDEESYFLYAFGGKNTSSKTNLERLVQYKITKESKYISSIYCGNGHNIYSDNNQNYWAIGNNEYVIL